MPEFRDREELEAWLKDKPVEWSRVIASRAALRALPLIIRARGADDWAGSIVLPVFRANFVAACIAGNPEAATRLRDSAHAAAGAINASADAAFATAFAAYAAADAADADAAAYAVGSAADAADYAAAYASDASAAARVWSAVGRDAGMLETGTPPERLALTHLWFGEGAHEVLRAAWWDLRQALRDDHEGWDVWIEWYEDIRDRRSRWNLSGDAYRAAAPRIAEQDDDWWQRTPAAVNADIAAWVEASRAIDHRYNLLIHASEDAWGEGETAMPRPH